MNSIFTSYFKGEIGRIYSHFNFDTPLYHFFPFFFVAPFFDHWENWSHWSQLKSIHLIGEFTMHLPVLCDITITPIARIFHILLVYHTCLPYRLVYHTWSVFTFSLYTCLIYC